jgi:hypothetical protein
MNSATKALLAPPAMQNLHDPSGIGYADTLDPQVPLSVRVGPYLDISEGDVIDLYCDNQRVINYTVKREDLAPGSYNFVVLPLDQKFIRQDSITLLYEVTNPIGGQKNQSVPATIPVKLTLPGGTDTNPATPYENERLAKPKVFPEGVITSPDNVRVEIAPYLNMFVGDKITLSWHGELIRTEITDQAQVGQPVFIPVSKDIIDLAGDSDMLEVRYEIRDVVNNWSRWSLPTHVDVEAGDASLPAPITPQAPGMELDLDQLAEADLQVLVISHPDIQRGDELVLSMERNTAEGMPLATYAASLTVSTVSSFYEFQVPNAQFQPIAQGRARLQYRVNKPSGNALRSKSLPLKIVGTPMELLPPRVPVAEQNNGVLDPASRNVRAEVPPYYFMAAGNDVHLFWMGKTEGGANVMHDQLIKVADGDVGSQIDLVIPDEKVSVLAGGSVEVYYTVNTFSRAFFKSPSLQLTVGNDQSGPLPLPTLQEAINDTLDPANTPNGATVVIDASASLRQGDQVAVSFTGPKGSDEKEKIIGAGDVGKAVSVVFSSALVNANEGEYVSVSYRVTRANGTVQDSGPYTVQVLNAWSVLPAPTIDTVGADGVLNPGLIPEAGATVLVNYDMRDGDQVKVVWVGASRHETDEQTVSGNTRLSFVVPKSYINLTMGRQGVATYEVSRGGTRKQSAALKVQVLNALSLDTSPVTLAGKVYMIPGRTDILPTFPSGATVHRAATGGQPPYTYRSSDPAVAHVANNGLTSVRDRGTATISVTDAAGQRLEYKVTVTGVIACIGFGSGKFDAVNAAVTGARCRLPSIQELREIHATYGNRWPMGNGNYWSSTPAKVTPFGKTYYVKNLVGGGELDAYTYSNILGVGIR